MILNELKKNNGRIENLTEEDNNDNDNDNDNDNSDNSDNGGNGSDIENITEEPPPRSI